VTAGSGTPEPNAAKTSDENFPDRSERIRLFTALSHDDETEALALIANRTLIVTYIGGTRFSL
jgi:hypothetical protein